MGKLIVFWLFFSSVAFANDYDYFAEEAIKDRNRYDELTINHHFYIMIEKEHYPVLAFVIASNTLVKNIEYSKPTVVASRDDTLLCYLNIYNLKWDYMNWYKVIKNYPYTTAQVPLIIRGDWLINQLTDTVENEGHYLLLYGKRPTKAEFLNFWKINEKQVSETFGFIEGSSQVSINKKRLIESYPVVRGNYAFSTKDSLLKDNTEDPLENLTNRNFKHDGEEWIVGSSKFIPSLGEWGTLQYYALFDGKGGLVNKADTDLVEDYSRFKGLAAIRTPGSCINCHTKGLNPPTKNEFRDFIASGAKIYAVKDSKDFIDIFYGSSLSKEIKRANEDYGTIIKYLFTNPDDFNKQFQAVINNYNKDLGLDSAAAELYNSSEDLKNAIGRQKKITSIIAKLAHNGKITRKQFENNWKLLNVFLKIK